MCVCVCVVACICTGGESGSADTVRDPRGFAVKFYTEDGNWDLVGNNTPIFFIRDPILVRGMKLVIPMTVVVTLQLGAINC